jgi:arsenite methyltransferase
MSASDTSSPGASPLWLWELLGVAPQGENATFAVGDHTFAVRNGIPRSTRLGSATQEHTRKTFGFKWDKRETFESAASRKRMREWLIERYGDVANAPWLKGQARPPVVLDAGCGAALSAIELFGESLHAIRYLGTDVSEAVDVAQARFREEGLPGAFLQCDLNTLPLAKGGVDVIFSEGVLHHTDSTEKALKSLVPLLRPGGRILFYVYKKKGPIREFTDDYIREKLRAMPMDDAWEAMMPLTKLGVALGELNVTLNVPEAIPLLDLPAGPIDLQRFFYWHVFKVFYRPDHDLGELNHINFDWYAPANAHRQTPEEVRRWCADVGLSVERENVQEAGITIVARAPE